MTYESWLLITAKNIYSCRLLKNLRANRQTNTPHSDSPVERPKKIKLTTLAKMCAVTFRGGARFSGLGVQNFSSFPLIPLRPYPRRSPRICTDLVGRPGRGWEIRTPGPPGQRRPWLNLGNKLILTCAFTEKKHNEPQGTYDFKSSRT
jgi:hypothetical protein